MDEFLKFIWEVIPGGASDIHVKIDQPFIYRKSGSLHKFHGPLVTPEQMDSIIEAILPKNFERGPILAGDFAWMHPDMGRYRVNLFLSNGKPTLVMRHVLSQIPEFEELHLPPVLKSIVESRSGVIFVSGSTGSGKSTSLAAMLDHINTNFMKRIITIEDPIEYMFTDKQSVISQKEMGLDIASFHDGLKYALRQDPDIIMIGELRDADSFKSALKAAETGHLVLTTLHADTAALAISRILEYFPTGERDQRLSDLSKNLRAIIGQRLIPTIDGGVRPANEILINTPPVRMLIGDNELDKITSAIDGGENDGMQTFDTALINLKNEGLIDQATAETYATNKEGLRMRAKGIKIKSGGGILGG